MLTIGEFSRICFVSKKTLRHYDEIGLLRPQHIADNGYRYYQPSQLRDMLFISRLKGYGFSLPEIAAALANPDPERLARLFVEQRARLRARQEQACQVLRQMEQDIEKLEQKEDIMNQNIVVETTRLEPQTIYSVRKTMKVDQQSFGEIMGQLYRELEEKSLRPTGNPMAFYHDADFDSECGDVEVAVPVAQAVPGTREVPGGLHAVVTLTGPYLAESFTAAYAGLCQWVEENGYRIAGAPFDHYVRGGDDCPPAEYLTKIYMPVAK